MKRRGGGGGGEREGERQPATKNTREKCKTDPTPVPTTDSRAASTLVFQRRSRPSFLPPPSSCSSVSSRSTTSSLTPLPRPNRRSSHRRPGRTTRVIRATIVHAQNGAAFLLESSSGRGSVGDVGFFGWETRGGGGGGGDGDAGDGRRGGGGDDFGLDRGGVDAEAVFRCGREGRKGGTEGREGKTKGGTGWEDGSVGL